MLCRCVGAHTQYSLFFAVSFSQILVASICQALGWAAAIFQNFDLSCPGTENRRMGMLDQAQKFYLIFGTLTTECVHLI